MNGAERITYFAEADFRNKRVPFGIKENDRSRHMYVIGKTGMGKSTMLENMAIQDIKNGEGMGFIDPHGASAEVLLDHVPRERMRDVVYFAPFDSEYPVSFNVMEDVGRDKRHLVADGLMSAFKKIWVDAWSARMEYILGNTLLALLEYPDATLLGVNRMLVDKEYRKKVVSHVTDPSVKSFWVDEFAKYTDRYTQEATPAIQNKIGQFVSNPIIRNIIGQPKSTFDIRQMMDEKKIFIMNLSKGKLGEQNANLIGSMLVTKIYLSAMSRADASAVELNKLPYFYFYVDEFQSFANESFADILSEARKYKLSLTIAHQYIEQMPEEVRAAVFGNVGSMITFRVGSYDADVLEKEFLPVFSQEDIVNLDKRQIYLRLMIDGVSSRPFSAVTLPPIVRPDISYKEDIVESSRRSFARSREIVEREVLDWHATVFGDSASQGETDGQSAYAAGQNASAVRKTAQWDGGRGERNRTAWKPYRDRETVPNNMRDGMRERREWQREDTAPERVRMPWRPPPPSDMRARAPEEERRAKWAPETPARDRREKEPPALAEDSREETRVSLDALRKGEVSSEKEVPSHENRNALKDAIAQAIAEKERAGSKIAPEQTAPQMPSTQTAAARGETVSTRVHAPKEIREDVLGGVLAVDEKK